MKSVEITSVKHPLEAAVTMPGSKSYTQRALVLAALAEGKSVLRNPLVAEDTSHLIAALRLLGADILSRNGIFSSRNRRTPGQSGPGNLFRQQTARPCVS